MKKKSQEVIRSVPARLWMSAAVDDQVRAIARAEGRSISAVYRDLVVKGLAAAGYRSGAQDVASMVRVSVDEAMKPQVERLASISAKAAQISAASFFLAYYNGRQEVSDYMKEEYDEIVTQSRKLGIEFLKLSKDKDLDAFIRKGINRMGGEND